MSKIMKLVQEKVMDTASMFAAQPAYLYLSEDHFKEFVEELNNFITPTPNIKPYDDIVMHKGKAGYIERITEIKMFGFDLLVMSDPCLTNENSPEVRTNFYHPYFDGRKMAEIREQLNDKGNHSAKHTVLPCNNDDHKDKCENCNCWKQPHL